MSEGDTHFALQRIYVKDLSFESPKAPEGFRQQWKPRVNLELNSKHNDLGDNHYEIVLSVTVTATNDEEDVIYLVEVQQAGVFLLRGIEGEELNQTLGSFCPSVLFPYAREVVDSVVTKGSFPPLMLAPVNFDAIFEQAEAARQAANIQ